MSEQALAILLIIIICLVLSNLALWFFVVGTSSKLKDHMRWTGAEIDVLDAKINANTKNLQNTALIVEAHQAFIENTKKTAKELQETRKQYVAKLTQRPLR